MQLRATTCMLFSNAQRFGAIVAVAIAAAVASAAQTGAPQVLRVDPPNWWLGHSINPVRLLIRGSNLTGAGVTAAGGLRVGAVTVNPHGSHIFVDVQINPQAKPGTRLLQITTARGST